MPLSGEKYVAPIWQNGGPPALDADELNAISQSIVRNQGGIDDLNALAQQLSAAVGGAARVEVGSYVGTGTYGSDSPNVLMIDFVPKLLIIDPSNWATNSSPSWPIIGVKDHPYLWRNGNYASRTVYVSWLGNSVSFYSEYTAATQLNGDGIIYYYIAIG